VEGLQINFTLVVQAIIFIAAIFIVTGWIIKPILRVIQERQNRVDGFHAEAGSFTAEFDQLKGDYEERLKEARQKARDIREELRRTGLASRERMLEQARQETQKYLDEIRAGLVAQIEEARSTLGMEAERLSREIARKILGRDAT